jgi:hypothetical protein
VQLPCPEHVKEASQKFAHLPGVVVVVVLDAHTSLSRREDIATSVVVVVVVVLFAAHTVAQDGHGSTP